MKTVLLALIGVFGALSATVAYAQSPRQLENHAGRPWKHKPSGLTFPVAMTGIQRSAVAAFSDDEWDIAARYDKPDGETAITVYVYQAAVFDPSIWFREAQHSIESRKNVFGDVTPLAPAAAFAPPGDSVASGLRMTYAAGGTFKSTALAIAPLGTEWIVKIRLSSQIRSAAELDGDMTALITALNWPNRAAPHVAATVAADCLKPIPQLEIASEIKGDGTSALLGGLGMLSATSGASAVPRRCRDAGLSGRQNVYRTEDGAGGYVLSLGDSGRAVIVEPDVLGALMAKEKGGATSYLVKHVEPGVATIFPALDRVPPVAQVIAIVNNGKWSSRTTREKNAKVTINSDMLK